MTTTPTEKYRKGQEAVEEVELGLRSWIHKAVLGGVALALSVASIVPFLYGHVLHNHWEQVGKYLVMLSMVLLAVFLFAVGIASAFWLTLRELRKDSER